MKDYYQILEIPKTADAVAIKKAYHRLAKLYHPDVNKGNLFFENKFKEINEAYAVLSDFKQKWQYDTLLNQPIVNTTVIPKQEPRKTYYPKGFNLKKYREDERKAQVIYNIVLVSFILFMFLFFIISILPKDEEPASSFEAISTDTIDTEKAVHHLSKEEFYRILDVEYKDSGDSTLWKSNEDSLYHVLDSMVNSH